MPRLALLLLSVTLWWRFTPNCSATSQIHNVTCRAKSKCIVFCRICPNNTGKWLQAYFAWNYKKWYGFVVRKVGIDKFPSLISASRQLYLWLFSAEMVANKGVCMSGRGCASSQCYTLDGLIGQVINWCWDLSKEDCLKSVHMSEQECFIFLTNFIYQE